MALLGKKKKTVEWSDMDKKRFVPYYGGLLLGVRATTHPYNVIKTRLMDRNSLKFYRGTMDCLFKVIKQEGFVAMYKGFSVQCCHIGTSLMYITSYAYTRNLVKDSYPQGSDFTVSFLAGGIAALVSQSIGVPVDVVSQFIMINRAAAKLHSRPLFFEEVKSLPVVCRDIYARGGARAFYNGFNASVLTFVPSSAILWGFYSFYTHFLLSHAPSTVPLFAVQACAGPLAAICAAPLSHPMDLVRVRIQLMQSPNVRMACADIYQSQGLAGFTRGLVPRAIAITHSSIIMLLCYETVKQLSVKKGYVDQWNDGTTLQ
ncbi:solute carrier family 25 member 44-like [Saccoglossus kowalevskii]|uniref:Solute carrier family 25 member 44-like n=1 Tax=Saccoglossus kowalevskii TaxID=10224 RepID=A0ABM0GSR0_SACKO|nr:PREDICTED: solute carrier family 25 member 44-like [Saccoglossus kowalevskii]